MSKVARKPAPSLGFEPDSIVHRQGMTLFHFVKSEAIEVMRPVWAQPCEQLRREFHAIRLQLLQRLRDGAAIVEDHQVGDQVVVFDDLELIVANVLGDRVGAEIGPLGKIVEAFALVLRGLDDASQVLIANVVEQERGANHPPELAKREVQFVLSAGRAQFSQYRRG